MKDGDKAYIVTAAEKLEQADVLYGIYDPIRATANLKPETKNAIKKVNESYMEVSWIKSGLFFGLRLQIPYLCNLPDDVWSSTPVMSWKNI